MGIITSILLSLVAGWLADRFMRGGYGLWATSSLAMDGSIAGAYVGGLIPGRDLMVMDSTWTVSSWPTREPWC